MRVGDTLMVAKLDRLALGAAVYDPTDPMGKMFFNILATFVEFEADLIRMRTRDGMKIACAKGKLRGKKPKLSDRRQRGLRRMYDIGDYSISDLAALFAVYGQLFIGCLNAAITLKFNACNFRGGLRNGAKPRTNGDNRNKEMKIYGYC